MSLVQVVPAGAFLTAWCVTLCFAVDAAPAMLGVMIPREVRQTTVAAMITRFFTIIPLKTVMFELIYQRKTDPTATDCQVTERLGDGLIKSPHNRRAAQGCIAQ